MDQGSSTKRKQYQPKVRTGCTTCKSRRIKCDEGRPTCQRCLKGKLLCTYDYIDIEPSTERSNTPRPAISTLFPVPAQYGDSEEVQALTFYLQRSRAMLSMASSAKDFWTVTVPQSSWTYPAVKHMLVAISLQDQLYASNSYISSVMSSKPALNRYSQAISILTDGQPTMSCMVIASLLAWKFECLVGDWNAANVHLQATRRIMYEYWTTHVSLNSCSYDVIMDVTEIIEQEQYRALEYENVQKSTDMRFETISEARNYIVDIIASLSTPSSDTLRAGERLLHWRVAFNTYLRYNGSQHEYSVKRQIYLLSNIIDTYLAFQTKSRQRYREPRQRHCVLNDFEGIIEYEELREIKDGILLLLKFLYLDADTSSSDCSRARSLEAQIIQILKTKEVDTT